MQEEVTRGAVTFIVDGAKLSEQVFEKAVKKFLEEIQKSQKPKIYRAGSALNSLPARTPVLPILRSVTRISSFLPCGEEIPCGFCLEEGHRRRTASLPVFFKSRDADAITAAFQEFASRKMSREEKPSIRERLTQAKEQAAEKTEHRTIDREKVKVKDRSVQR